MITRRAFLASAAVIPTAAAIPSLSSIGAASGGYIQHRMPEPLAAINTGERVITFAMRRENGEWVDIGLASRINVQSVESYVLDPRAYELLHGKGAGKSLGIFNRTLT